MPTTTNFGWTTPADTGLVKDGASAIRTLGNGIDTSLVDLKGGTTSQVLTKDSATDLDFSWKSSGLTLVKNQTIGSAVSSVTVSDAFSSTYDNYRILITGGASSAAIEYTLTFGSTTSGYKWNILVNTYGSTNTVAGSTSDSSISVFRATASGINTVIEVLSPNLAKHTAVRGYSVESGQFNVVTAIVPNTTAYTAFTITNVSGTLTGGNIRVYGYGN